MSDHKDLNNLDWGTANIVPGYNLTKTLPVHVFCQAAAVKLLKTPPNIDQRRMETEAQTLEEGRTQVSNCSNTDVMK